MKFTASLALLFTLTVSALSQTAFPGISVGQKVTVNSTQPLMVIGNATVTAITATNITVQTRLETLSFDTTATVRPAKKVVVVNQPTYTAPQAQLDAAQNQVLGNYRNQGTNYENAVKYYQTTMAGVQNGSVNLDDLVAQAESTLKNIDQYQPERAKDPQYEAQIAQLRDFVARAKAGEKITP